MGEKHQPVGVYGIAYHSPLDIISLVPHSIKITLDPETPGDILFNRKYLTDYQGTQVVFASQRRLTLDAIPILDQGKRGKILNLRQVHWNKFLKGQTNE